MISSNVADAKIDIVAEGVLTESQRKGWLLRFNDKISPDQRAKPPDSCPPRSPLR